MNPRLILACLGLLAMCFPGCGERISPAYYGDEGFVEDFYDPGYDALRDEIATYPWKEIEWDHKFNNREIARLTLGGDHLYVETPDHQIISINRFSGRTAWIYKVDTDTPLDFPPVEAHGAPEEIRELEAKRAEISKQIDDVIKEKGLGPETDALRKKRQEVNEQLRVAAYGDNVYFLSRQVIYCLDRLSGNLRWTRRLIFAPSAQPFAIRSHVFISGGDLSRVWKLDVAKKGKEIYFYKPDLNQPQNYVMNRPVVDIPSLYFVSHDGGIYSFTSTGKRNWRFPTLCEIKADPILHLHAKVTKASDGTPRTQYTKLLFVGSQDFAFYALDADAGALLWKYETGGAGMTTAAVAKDDTVYVKTNGGALLALEVWPQHKDPKTGAETGMKRDGRLRWKLPLGERFLVKGADRVYILASNRVIESRNEFTGAVLGRFRTNLLQHLITNNKDGYMYVANSAGYIFCLKESKSDL